ncbi:acetyltransferase [Bacteroidia bacterium]|nr:acetyltransferase [Bacteroidia bacterium]
MNKRKKQIRDLWKLVFGDSNSFIRLFFGRVYQDANALSIEKDGEVVCALQMLPYTMQFYGEEISVAYIAGVCTHPAERGKGLAKQLMEQAVDEMKKRGIALSALIPAEKWLSDYYRPFGYTETFEYSLKVYTRHEWFHPEPTCKVVRQVNEPSGEIFAYFDRKLRERPLGILHSQEDFQVIFKDLTMSDGVLSLALNKENHPVGMAFVAKTPPTASTESSVLIKEFLYDDESIKKQLLYAITKDFGVEKAVYRYPVINNSVPYPYGMARVIDTERLIALWTATHPDSSISPDAMRALDIPTLTARLLDYPHRTAYMSLMLD